MKFLSPFRMIILSFSTVILAVLGVQFLNIDLINETKTNELSVSFASRDSSPELIEQQISSVLENVLSQLRDLKNIRSLSAYGYGVIELAFDQRVNIEEKRFEVLSLLRQVKDKLPPGTEFPTVNQGNYDANRHDLIPLLVYSVNSNVAGYQMRETVERAFRKGLISVDEVAKIEVSGLNGRQITIEFDQKVLHAHHLEPLDLIADLQLSLTHFFPGSTISDRGERVFINVANPNSDLSDIGNTVISAVPGFRLKHVANIYYEDQSAKEHFRINGKSSVTLSIYGKKGINGIAATKKIADRLPDIRQGLPPGFDIMLELDSTDFISKELAKGAKRLVFALLLLLVTVSVTHRKWYSSLIVFAGMMVNTCMVIMLYLCFDIQVNIYTLACLTVSLGVVASFIVMVLDNYHSKKNAAILPVLTGIIVTITTLILADLIPSNEVYRLSGFSTVLSMALIATIATNVFFTFSMCKLLLPQNPIEDTKTWIRAPHWQNSLQKYYHLLIGHVVRFRILFIASMLFLFGLPLFLLPYQWEGQAWYNTTFGTAVYQDKVRPYVDQWTGGVWRLFKIYVDENNQYLDPGETVLHIDAELPIGNTVGQMNEMIGKVERYLSKFDGVDKFVTRIASGQEGKLAVTFANTAGSVLPGELKNKLTKKALEWGGVNWHIYGVGKGFSNKTLTETPTFKLKMAGYNYDQLERQARWLSDQLLQNDRIPSIDIDAKDVQDQLSAEEFFLKLERGKLGLKGISNAQIFHGLKKMSKPNMFQSALQSRGEIIPIVFKEKNSEDYDKWNLMNANTYFDQDRVVKLNGYGDVVLRKTSGAIIKENREYIRVLEFDYMGSFETGASFLEQVITKSRLSLPTGYSVKLDQDQADSKRDWGQYVLILVMVLVCYVVCAIFFEDLKLPATIICLIPISFIFVLFSFYLLDCPYDQGGYAAFLITGCMVVNFGILVLGNLKRRLALKDTYNEALVTSMVQHKRTIVCAALSTISVSVPFLFFEDHEIFWSSFAVGAIAGLTGALFSIFVVLPVFLWKSKS